MAASNESKRTYNAKYYAANREREKQRALKWYHENYAGDPSHSEERKRYMSEYYASNKQEWHQRTPEQRARYNAKRREEYASNPEFREQVKQQVREWVKNNPAKAKAQDLKENFGITIEQFNAMMSAQGGKCAICGRSERKWRVFPMVDHCHKVGRVRGILCCNCNYGLGHFKDNPDLLRNAAAYLEATRG